MNLNLTYWLELSWWSSEISLSLGQRKTLSPQQALLRRQRWPWTISLSLFLSSSLPLLLRTMMILVMFSRLRCVPLSLCARKSVSSWWISVVCLFCRDWYGTTSPWIVFDNGEMPLACFKNLTHILHHLFSVLSLVSLFYDRYIPLITATKNNVDVFDMEDIYSEMIGGKYTRGLSDVLALDRKSVV